MGEFVGNRTRKFAPWRFRCDWIRVAMTAVPMFAAAYTNTYPPRTVTFAGGFVGPRELADERGK